MPKTSKNHKQRNATNDGIIIFKSILSFLVADSVVVVVVVAAVVVVVASVVVAAVVVSAVVVAAVVIGNWQLRPLSMLPPGPMYASVQLGHLHPGLQ